MSAGLIYLLLFAAGCARRHHPWARVFLQGELATPSVPLVKLLHDISIGTSLEDRIVVNAEPRNPQDLVIVFVAEGAVWNPRMRNVRNNCTSLAEEVTIVCDTAFLKSYFPRRLKAKISDSDQFYFESWVLAHELGHVVDGERGRHASGSMSQVSRNLAQQRLEYDADCWMLNRILVMRDPALAIGVERIAMDVINSRVRRDSPNPPYGVGIIFDYNRIDPYDFTGFEDHPDMLLRATRLLHVSSLKRNDTALAGMVRPLIRKLVPDPLWEDKGPCSVPAVAPK